MPDEIIIEDDKGDSYFMRRKIQGDINSPAMEALKKHASVLTKEGKPEITEEEIEKLRAQGMSAEEIQTQIEGVEKDPWVDPTTVASAAFGGAGLISLKAGVKVLPSLGRALTAGMVGGVAEYPLGMATEEIEAGKYPGLALPFAITVGLLSGVTVENAIEKAVIRSLTKKGVKVSKKLVSEGIKKVKTDLEGDKIGDEVTADSVEELNKLIDAAEEEKVISLITKPVREFREKFRKGIGERVEEILEKVNKYEEWEFEVGSRIKSRETERVYEITAKSWDTKKDKPLYNYKGITEEEQGQFIADRAHKEFTLLEGPKALKAEEPIATFRGWQETAEGKEVAYYNVGKDTMTKEGLARRGLEVPETPPSPKEIDEVMKIGDSREPLVKIVSEAEPKTVEFLGEEISEIPEKAININFGRIDTPDDIKKVITKTADVYGKGIQEARRGEVTNIQTSRLANLLGMSVETLLKRQKGEAFNAQEVIAARRILVSSAENLVGASNKILLGKATDLDKFAFQKMFATHYAIQAQVSGMTAEAGRALQSFKMMARTSEGKVKEIKKFMDSLGTSRGITSEELAALLSKIDSVEGITRFVKEAQKATKFDMFIEAWINGLLSGPQTHAVNTLSNSLVAFWQIPERFLASGFGKVLPGKGEISGGEALEQCYGLVEGFKDGLRLFGKALWTGESDTFSKIEVRHRRAISARNLNIDEAGVAGRAIDLLGEGVRIPGRFLGAEDEFFKAIGYRMELRARAFRQARVEGLEGEAAAKRIQDVINEPPDDIRLEAMDAARYQTFTQELGKFGKGVQSVFSEAPALKLIAPFIRTPINIMKFAGERTPLALVSRRIRGDIMAGGARRDLALARVSLGSMVMATTATLAADEVITGGGPSDPALRNIKRNTGWQPYSIKIGEKYYAYNRLEPLGVLLGMAADITEIAGELNRGEAENLTVLAVAGLSKNVLSKTWLRGLSETLTMLSDPERYGKRWLQKYVESAIPTGVAQLERVIDPTMSQVGGYLDALRARIPGYSATLPPRRNLWGEPITLEGGLGPDIVSPVYVSTGKYSPIDEELLRLRVPLSMPRKTQSIHGESIELNVKEYDRFLVQMNEVLMPDTGKNLRDTLNHLVTVSPEYRNMPEDQKEMRIRSYLVMAKALAREKLWEESSSIKWLVDHLQFERMQVQ